MQKLLFILFMIVATSSRSDFSDHSALQDFQSIPISIEKEKESARFLESLTTKNETSAYLQQEDEVDNIADYDQNITDNVKPPVIGPVQAMCQELLASLLIRYIIMREAAHNYFQTAKNMCSQLCHKITNIGH